MPILCPRCGSRRVLPQKTTFPEGFVQEYYCAECDLLEDARVRVGETEDRDREALACLKVRWGEWTSTR